MSKENGFDLCLSCITQHLCAVEKDVYFLKCVGLCTATLHVTFSVDVIHIYKLYLKYLQLQWSCKDT